jgi:Helix-turn-helix domain
MAEPAAPSVPATRFGRPRLRAGERYGRWTVIADEEPGGSHRVPVRCDCGTEATRGATDLREARTSGCRSCWARERAALRSKVKPAPPIEPLAPQEPGEPAAKPEPEEPTPAEPLPAPEPEEPRPEVLAEARRLAARGHNRHGVMPILRKRFPDAALPERSEAAARATEERKAAEDRRRKLAALGVALRAARRRRGLDVEAVAKMASVPAYVVRRAEAGAPIPGSAARALVRALSPAPSPAGPRGGD